MEAGPPRRRPHLDPDPAGVIIPDPADRPQRARLPFPAVAARIPALGHEADRAVLEALHAAPVKGVGRILYSSNAAFLLELDAPDPADPGKPLRAVYKPARGERPLWDFPRRTLHRRETAAYLVDAALGLGLVPPTALRSDPLGEGSVQQFMQAGAETQLSGERLETELRRLASLDVILNNADRKRAHLLLDDRGLLRGIDNALSFLPYPRQRTVLIDYGGEAIAPDVLAAIATLLADRIAIRTLREALLLLLDGGEVEALFARLRELRDDPVFPVLDPWDGRPWEWA